MGRRLEDLVCCRRWSAGDARVVLGKAEGSGLSLREFCRRHGLDAQRLYRWRRDLVLAASSESEDGGGPTFAEVIVPRTFVPSYEIGLASGRVVRVGPTFDEGALRRLLAVVDGEGEGC